MRQGVEAHAVVATTSDPDAVSLGISFPVGREFGDAHRNFCSVLEQQGDQYALLQQQKQQQQEQEQQTQQHHLDQSLDTRSSTASSPLASPALITQTPFRGSSRDNRHQDNAKKHDTRPSTFNDAAAAIRAGLVGRNARFHTPFGHKPLVYADWTATGRPVAQIENHLRDEVMPLFGNTHTTTSITGAQTTCFRHEARQIIAEAVNAKVCKMI